MSVLNPEQAAVVSHAGGPLLVVAVAGCGKTRVVVDRVAALVDRGVDQQRILALTFSVKAAQEMNGRLAALDVVHTRVGTFHSLSWQIAREEVPSLIDWEVDNRDRYRFVVKDALGYQHLDWKTADLTVVLSYIARCKAATCMPGSDAALELAQRMHAASPCNQRDPALLSAAYSTAEELREQRQILTYDDMLLKAWSLLTTDESCRARWASRWDYVIQDEAQDENIVQREIAAALARDHREYMVVGDPAQSIYGFRGSDPTGLLRFRETWGADTVGMARNYRSARSIVDVANRALDAMAPATHLGVKLVAERDLAGVVDATRYASFDEEGQGIALRLLQSHTDGQAWKDNVVLYRTNAQSRGVEEALLESRIPYVLLGGTNFYERREIKDLLAYLRLAAGRGEFDDVRRSINTPFRFLGRAFVDGLASLQTVKVMNWAAAVRERASHSRANQGRQRTAAEGWCTIIDRLAQRIDAGVDGTDVQRLAARPARLLQTLVDDISYHQWLTRAEGTESPENNRVSNVRELIRAAERFPTTTELLDYIEETLEKAAAARTARGSADCVTLTSLHRSKGLEWPVVYLIGANEKILPHARAEDLQEERRLFYVGVTRARDELHVSCVQQAAIGSRVVQLEPSPFLLDVGIELRDDKSSESAA